MKILVISSVHSWDDIRIFRKQVLSLAKNYEVYLAGIGSFTEKEENNVTIYGLKKRARCKRFLIWWDILKITFRVKPEIVHFHDPELLIIGLFLKIFTSIKTIYDVHEDYPAAILSKKWVKPILRKWVSAIFKIFERLSSRLMDGVITVSENIAVNFSNNNTIVIKNYSNLQTWDDFSLKVKENSAIFLGGLSQIRGINEIIRAAELVVQKIPDFKLYLIGPFTGEKYRAKVLQEIEEREYIRYMGFLGHLEALPYLRKSKIGLLCYLPVPNHLEAVPNKIFEYMSQGLVVLASHFKVWKEILISETGCGMVCNPESPEDIADKIISILLDDQLVEKKGKQAIQEVKEKYSWDFEEKKLINFYQELRGKTL